MNIEIKERNKLKESLSKLRSRIEDVTFSIVSKIPERFIPKSVMEWLNYYLDKRICQLESESIKSTWRSIHLENLVDDIHDRQVKNKHLKD